MGGLGTRLGTLTANTPKPLLRCGDRPFLAWLLREFVRFGVEEFVLLSGHLSGEVVAAAEALTALLPRGVRIAISEEPVRAGTGGAVFHARERLDQRFLLCNGDSLFDCNLANLLAAAAEDAPGIGRMLLRQVDDAFRYGVVTLDGDRVSEFLPRASVSGEAGGRAAKRIDAPPPRPSPASREREGGLINAGIYLFDRSLIEALSPDCSLETDVLPRLAARGALRGTVAGGYFRDIGVPEDFALADGEIPGLLHRPALFLDRDGVMNVDHGWVGTRERFEWTAGAREAVRLATQAGWHVFVVTNQSGVARGHYDEAAVRTLHGWMVDEVRRAGGTIDDIRYCPYHEDAVVEAYRRASDWRKPAPGMLLDLIRTWELDPARCILVGDQPSDLAAAAEAGIRARRFQGGNLADFVRPIIEGRTA